MSKLKNDVDFKELKKYGFKYIGNWARGDRWERKGYDSDHDVIIDGEDRHIGYTFPYVNLIRRPIKFLIQDLIEAGLVEEEIINE